MELNNKVINICILSSKEIKEFCTSFYNQDKSDYFESILEYTPHITLSIKALSTNDGTRYYKK